MSKKYIRIFQQHDVKEMKPHMIVYGDLGGFCGNCDSIKVKLEHAKCPECETDFRYIAFRNPKVHMPKLYKLAQDRPQMTFVDFEDYTRVLGASKAEDFFG